MDISNPFPTPARLLPPAPSCCPSHQGAAWGDPAGRGNGELGVGAGCLQLETPGGAHAVQDEDKVVEWRESGNGREGKRKNSKEARGG